MTKKTLSGNIDKLFQRGEWDEARNILERERELAPDNHWVLTQLGVTFYEQRRYQEALQWFLASQTIVPDCPLTLWNLAGALDSLGKYAKAMQIYTWLLRSKKSPEDDPCWESKEWTDALKTDCVYRRGVCFQHLHKKRMAEECYHHYLDLLSIGIEGSYSMDDVRQQLRDLHGEGRPSAIESQVRKAANAARREPGNGTRKGQRNRLPELNVRDFFPGQLAASKK